MGRHDYAGLLYSQPSFGEGFARVLDIGGTFDAYSVSPTPNDADELALASDWYAVGADLHRSILRFLSHKRDRPGNGEIADTHSR